MKHLVENYTKLFYQFVIKANLHDLPEIMSIEPIPGRDNAYIWRVQNVYPPDLSENIDLLNECLEGMVFDISFGETTDEAQFQFKPNRKDV